MGYSSPMPAFPYPPGPNYWYPPPTPPRPTGAFVLSLIAGLLIFFGGVVEFFIGLSFVSFVAAPIGILAIFGGATIVMGVIIIALAVELHSHPERHVSLGVGILILSIASIIGSGGGILGLILGAIGGALAISFSPAPETPFAGGWAPSPYYGPTPPGPMFYPAPWPPQAGPFTAPSPAPSGALPSAGPSAYTAPDRGRPCPKCGRLLAYGARFCSYCGSPAQ